MFCDIFAGVQLLNLALQKSGESLVLADIPVYLDKTMSFLEKLKSANKRPFFTKPNFNKLFDFSKEAMASFLPSSCTQSNQQLFEWAQFETDVHMPFLDALMKEVEAAFEAVCVEHLFSKMKLRKTNLRNHPGETTLDSLLQISTESPTGFDDDEYKYFVVELKLK